MTTLRLQTRHAGAIAIVITDHARDELLKYPIVVQNDHMFAFANNDIDQNVITFVEVFPVQIVDGEVDPLEVTWEF